MEFIHVCILIKYLSSCIQLGYQGLQDWDFLFLDLSLRSFCGQFTLKLSLLHRIAFIASKVFEPHGVGYEKVQVGKKAENNCGGSPSLPEYVSAQQARGTSVEQNTKLTLTIKQMTNI